MYVHGKTPTAQLINANARVNYLEQELARLKTKKPRRADQWPSFDSPEFMAAYERERVWAARRWPETTEVKQARLAAATTDATHRTSRKLAA